MKIKVKDSCFREAIAKLKKMVSTPRESGGLEVHEKLDSRFRWNDNLGLSPLALWLNQIQIAGGIFY